jgi:hypothetical protein
MELDMVATVSFSGYEVIQKTNFMEKKRQSI